VDSEARTVGGGREGLCETSGESQGSSAIRFLCVIVALTCSFPLARPSGQNLRLLFLAPAPVLDCERRFSGVRADAEEGDCEG
jgi:hypothetical protein